MIQLDISKKLSFLMKHLLILLSLAMLAMISQSCEKKAAVGPPEKITIAYATLPHAALFHVALVKGFFQTEGLEVTPQPYPFGKAALNAVLEGKADMATTSDTTIMFAITGGHKINVVASISASNKDEAIIARKDRGIAAPLDIKGKNIGVSLGTGGDFFMDSFLVTHGIGRNKVKIVDIKPDEMLDALIKGRVDAVSTWIPNIQYMQKGLGDSGITFYDAAIVHALFCLPASQEFAKQHPETIKKVLRAFIRAETFVRENPGESKRLVAEFIKMDRPLLDAVWNSFNYRVTLDQALLVSLEDQTRWAMKNKLSGTRAMPNFLEFIYFDGLQAVKPDAVSIMR
jgi:sulfonate transport system substrate-binding protein